MCEARSAARVIWIMVAGVSPPLLNDIKRVIAEHPGEFPACLLVIEADRLVKLTERVDWCEAFVRKLNALHGVLVGRPA